jgi:hypothetical protein
MTVRPWPEVLIARQHGGNREAMMKTLDEQRRTQAVTQAAERLGRDDTDALRVLTQVWDTAFEEGRLAALDEFQDRFCVCMK